MLNKTQLKQVLKLYGKTALVFHSTVFVSTFLGCYTAIHKGIDVNQYLDRVPGVDLARVDPKAGSAVMAYVMTIATGKVNDWDRSVN